MALGRVAWRTHAKPSSGLSNKAPLRPLAVITRSVLVTDRPTAATTTAAAQAPPITHQQLAFPADAPLQWQHAQQQPLPTASDAAALPKGCQQLVEVSFCVQYRCGLGAAVHVSGSAPSLGGWRPNGALRMDWTAGDNWVATVKLPAGTSIEYKYVVLDRSGRPTRWQEGPNLALTLPTAEQAVANGGRVVDVMDSWCQRMQLRRSHELGNGPRDGGSGSSRASPHHQQYPDLGVWEFCGPGGQLPRGASSNVVAFDRSSAARSGLLARSMGVSDAAPLPAGDPDSGSFFAPHQQRFQAAAVGGRTHAHDNLHAQSLPELQHELEEALAAALDARATGGRGAAHGGAADDASFIEALAEDDDALGAAVEELRHLQSRALDRGCSHGGSPPALESVECLRGAFSPASGSEDDPDVDVTAAEDVRGDYYQAGVGGSSSSASSLGGSMDLYDVAVLGRRSCDGVDPLVAALLSDDCALCCAYVHDAICSSSAINVDPPEEADAAAAAPHALECGEGAAQQQRRLQRRPRARSAAELASMRDQVVRGLHEALMRSERLSTAHHEDPAHPEMLMADRAVAAANRAMGGSSVQATA